MSLVGTLAVPLMALGFVAAAHLLARRARKTGIVAGSLLVLGMWGFLAGLTTELIQITALLDGAKGVAAAEWMQGLDSQPLLGIVYGFPFMLGCVLGMLTLTTGLLVKGAGVPRWIPAAWLVFIVLDFSIGAVGPIDPHWLYFAGAVGLAATSCATGAGRGGTPDAHRPSRLRVGATPGREHGRAAGVGLGSMRERVVELGGWCTVEARESGTEVVAVLPLPVRVPDPVPAPVAERA